MSPGGDFWEYTHRYEVSVLNGLSFTGTEKLGTIGHLEDFQTLDFQCGHRDQYPKIHQLDIFSEEP